MSHGSAAHSCLPRFTTASINGQNSAGEAGEDITEEESQEGKQGQGRLTETEEPYSTDGEIDGSQGKKIDRY
ncbi:hypothetical protein O3P69_005541 [Scylla paramamosain]|uniref:Uncharacterized protein n=1 Tax=Scylla paramamosain TaxID=85552 RepID=A0AAW0U601_SCYPA